MRASAVRCGLAILLVAAFALSACVSGPGPIEHTFARSPDGPRAGASRMLGDVRSGRFEAYVVGDPESSRGLVLFHEWWGLTESVRAEADRYAEVGYYVVAPNLYGHMATTNSRVARRYMRGLDQRAADRMVAAALEMAGTGGRPVGVLGWCFGGGQALRAALENPGRVNAVVTYYGELETNPERLSLLRAPVLGIFAEQDSWITPARVAEFTRAMAGADRLLEVASYDAGHAFANPSGPNYEGEAARDARALTERFLDTHLLGAGTR
jgi:carboxymethylenebutenolidase